MTSFGRMRCLHPPRLWPRQANSVVLILLSSAAPLPNWLRSARHGVRRSPLCTRYRPAACRHRLRRDREKVRAVLPVHIPVICEPEICLVYQSRRFKRVSWTPPPQIIAGNPAQFLVDKRYQPVERRLVALTPLDEQFSDSFGRGRHLTTPSDVGTELRNAPIIHPMPTGA